MKNDPNGLDTATSYHNLGALYREAGRYSESLPALNKALELRRAALGRGSVQVVSTLVELAGTQRALGNLDAAKATLAQAQSIASEKYDKNDRRHAALRAERGRQELVAGHLDAAESELTAAVAGYRAQDMTPRLPESLGTLGEVQLRTGHPEAALASLNEALTLWRTIVPPEHWCIADAQSRLGEALFDSGQRLEGLKLMTEALPTLRAHRPEGDSYTLAAERRLEAASSSPPTAATH